MEMIRTFRIYAIERGTHAIRDFKYTESFIVSGNTATVSYYDDEFTTLSTDTIDLTQYRIQGMPNKTSRKGVYYKKKPLPSIMSLVPVVAVFKYIPVTVPVKVPTTHVNTLKPNITISKGGIYTVGVSVPTISVSHPSVTVAHS